MSEKMTLLREIARLERTAADRLDEIIRLQVILTAEQEKTTQYSQQIDEMTDFLADYGLHWVGGPGPAHAPLFPRGPTDMAEFMARISRLNAMADSSPTCETVAGVTRLCRPSVHIHFTDEGFAIDTNDLRPYAHPLSTAFFQDIMDGFFPVEFKAKYPEGVTLVIDDQRKNELFKGEARRLVDSAHREKRAQWKPEIGDGAGQLKVRFADGKETVVRTSADTTVASVRVTIQRVLGLEVFRLAAPTGAEVDEARTVGELGLFPRGLVLLLEG
jgi:hypothetical protein